VIKFRMRWAMHVAHMGERGVRPDFLWWNLKERDHREGLGVYGKIILKWIFKKCNGNAWTGLI
jgi:hypothetical protein